jgi:hypothetical protein
MSDIITTKGEGGVVPSNSDTKTEEECQMCGALAMCVRAHPRWAKPLMGIGSYDAAVDGHVLDENVGGQVRWIPVQGTESGFVASVDEQERVAGLLFFRESSDVARWSTLEYAASIIAYELTKTGEALLSARKLKFHEPPEGVKGVKACEHSEDMTEVLRRSGIGVKNTEILWDMRWRR